MTRMKTLSVDELQPRVVAHRRGTYRFGVLTLLGMFLAIAAIAQPTISLLNPASATAGASDTELAVTGTNFEDGAVVVFGTEDLTTTWGSATGISATIPAALLAVAGTPAVTVRNPDDQVSNALTFTIEAPAPAPTISLLNPISATAGAPDTELAIAGTNFVDGAVVVFGGVDLATDFGNSTSVSAIIPAALLEATGTPAVLVRNPDDQVSNAPMFTIEAPVPAPTISLLNPESATAGALDTALAVTGTNFVDGAVVVFGGVDLATDFGNSTSVSAIIPAALLEATGTPAVLVRNPDDQVSNALTFTIDAPVPAPTISLLNPASATAGAPDTALAVTGTNFVDGAVVVFGGTDLATTWGSATGVSATIPAALLAAAGTPSVTVRNPDDEVSNALTFTIEAPTSVPTISLLNPAAATAGAPDTELAITGTNFVDGAVVVFGGVDIATTWGSSAGVSATIPTALLAAAGAPAVTVRNPDDQVSNALTFTIAEPSEPLVINTLSNLGLATRSVPFAAQLEATGGVEPLSWELVAPAQLPPGLSLAGSTGLITGTPTQLGTFTFAIRVSDAQVPPLQATAQRTFTLQVQEFTISTSSLPDARVGVAYTGQLNFTGGPTTDLADYRWILSGGPATLPPGLSFNASTGTISGTPEPLGGTSQNFNIQVAAEYIPTGLLSPSRLLTISVTGGGLDITLQTLPAGAVGQAYGPDGTGMTFQAVNGTAPYTIDFSPASLAELLAAGFEVDRPNAEIPGFIVTLRLGGTPTSAGQFTVQVVVRDGVGTQVQRDLPLLILPTALSISPATLPPASVGVAYQQPLTVEGLTDEEQLPLPGQAVVTWELITPVPGLTLSINGTLIGNFTEAGERTFAVRASTLLRSISQQFVLSITAARPTITTTSLPPATVGTAYTAEINASGGIPGYTWDVAGIILPAGLMFDAASVNSPTLRIAGTPSQGAESRTFSITVRDSLQLSDTREFTLGVTGVPIPALSLQPFVNAGPAEQKDVVLTLAQPYPLPLSGTATVTFEPNATNNADDPNIRFLAGERNASFTFSPNSTTAVFPNVTQQQVQTGTVAGTVRVRASISGDGPADVQEFSIARSAPVILDGLTIQSTSGGFTVSMNGYSTPRDLASALVTFTPTPGTNLQTTQLTISLTSAATEWYTSDTGRNNGSAFRLSLPFTVQGGTNAVQTVTVTLVNSSGNSNTRSVSF